VYRARRRRTLLVAALGFVVAWAVFRPASRLLDGRAWGPDGQQGPLLSRNHPADGSAVSWPQRGQAAIVLGSYGGRTNAVSSASDGWERPALDRRGPARSGSSLATGLMFNTTATQEKI
jgi:hypothetical protein